MLKSERKRSGMIQFLQGIQAIGEHFFAVGVLDSPQLLDKIDYAPGCCARIAPRTCVAPDHKNILCAGWAHGQQEEKKNWRRRD